MKALFTLAIRSAWNRRFVLSLVVISMALSTFLLMSIERIRVDVRDSFSQAVSGTDLIIGARTSPVQLLLYSVFRMGGATNNIRWGSVQEISQHQAVAWVVPISLGDSHRGFPVVATTDAYFEHFQYGDRQALALSSGTYFDGVFDAVLGSEVAQRLGYGLGQQIILSHGDGAIEDNDHHDKPFKVVGILKPTGTPVDRSVHIKLEGMQAMHSDWIMGIPMPGVGALLDPRNKQTLTPKHVTAVLVGLKSRTAVFAVQRAVAEFANEPLLAVLPAVALDELWSVIGVGEKGLLAMSALVTLVSLISLVAVVLAGLHERRRELAVLRAVGAGPRDVLILLAMEGVVITLSGVILGVLVSALTIFCIGDWIQVHWGITVHLQLPSIAEWYVLATLLLCGWIASLLPGYRAYQLSLADGLAPRI